MSAFEVYKDYVALKNHFSKPNYDYVKYNGKLKLKSSSFEGRKDKLFFQKLAKRTDYHDFLVANLSHDHRLWIRDLAYSDEADRRFLEWKKRQQSLSYIFKSEVSEHLNITFDSNFICVENGHPLLFKTYLSGAICLETLCIMLELTDSKKYWDRKMEYDPVWQEYSLKIEKYMPFIKYDKQKFRKILLDFYGKD